jgi:hypothetical protein
MPSPPSLGLAHPQSYTPITVAGDAMVMDNVTGLLWQRDGSTNPADYSWQGAMAYCESLVLGGYCDWRLPSRIELLSLVDYTRSGPTIDTTSFPNTVMLGYWSASSADNSGSPEAWFISFANGDTYLAPSSSPSQAAGPARCVRGGRDVRPDHYTVGTGATAGAIRDNETGLTWQSDLSPSTFMFGDSSFCDDATTGGFDDWRLPTITELQTIMDDTRTAPSVDTNMFPIDPDMNISFWTSTPYGTSGFGRAVNFYLGISSGSVVANKNRVRCVR